MKLHITITPDGINHVLLAGVLQTERRDGAATVALQERRCHWDGPGLVEDLEDMVDWLAEEIRARD